MRRSTRLLLLFGPAALAAALILALAPSRRTRPAHTQEPTITQAPTDESTPIESNQSGEAADSVVHGLQPAGGTYVEQPLRSPPPTTAPGGVVNLRRTVTVEVAERTKDAVVYVSTTKLIERRASPFGDPFWQFDRVVKVPANSLGSGFIIHRDGYVVTNNHVIDRARQITVELLDGRKLPADLISADAEADLAILRIHSPKPLPTLELGDSSDLMIGEPVIAVGNPLGYSHTVSTGIVSALHRDLSTAGDQEGASPLRNLIQTDAAINPGNSGGPLLNAYGQVIGINTAIRSDAQNIGFSIAVNRLRDLIPELMNPAQVTKVNIPIRLAERRTITPPATIQSTVVVSGLKVGSAPAAITAIDGRPVGNIVDAYVALLDVKPDQKQVALTLATGQQIHFAAGPVPLPDAIVDGRRRLGVTVEQMTPLMAEKYHIDAEDGLFVSEVAKDSPASRAGIEPGDVITQMGRYRVANLTDFGALLHRLPDSGQVRIGVIRGQQVGYGVLKLP